MSHATPMPSDRVASGPSRPSFRFPRWTREPLLHFLVIGAVLFGVDHVLVSRTDDPHTIFIDEAVDRQAKDVFKASRGRDPDAKELAALRRVWLDNEVLYREGLAMQLDRGDVAIRERVIFKALSMVDANTKLPEYDDATLRQWFDAHREKYDEPARFTFDEAVLAGEPKEAAIRAFVEQLNHGTPGDANAGLRVFKGRPHANLVDAYGDDFARALERSTVGEWRAIRSKDGWRAVRLSSSTPAVPGNYASLRGIVLQDWTDATLSQQRSDAVEALTKKYTVKVGSR